MKKLLSVLLMTAVLLSAAVGFTGCGKEKSEPMEEPVQTDAVEETAEELPFEEGELADDKYVNNWADVTVPVPENTQPMTGEEMKNLLDEACSCVTGEETDETHEHIGDNIVPLFMVDDADDAGKLKIQYTAEEKNDIETAEEYLETTIEQLSQVKEDIEFAKENEVVEIGGQEYLHNSIVREDGVTIDYYVRAMQEKFLVLSVGHSEERADEAHAWIESIDAAAEKETSEETPEAAE
ncbi:MAG: hypothetical protein IKV41_01100 [Oscillospiraceae bacterium]|nr:hypothetical protein [Oscillospiraceae bacterium]